MSDSERLSGERRIRSYSRRQGRITTAQREALQTLWKDYCLDPDRPFDAAAVFSRSDIPLILEIGFGNGNTLLEMAAADPEKDYLGIEVHRPGVGHLMRLLAHHGVTNVRIYCADAVDVLKRCLPDENLDGVNLFFPDPWPKKRHHKRRLVTPEFIDLIAKKLKVGGRFHTATDWEDYAQSMASVLEANRHLRNTAPSGSFAKRPGQRPLTKFERRGLRLGHRVRDLVYQRI
jgi:tRNA (guanine-N7-)-methyltransferase